MRYWKVKIELRPQDLWIGAYWASTGKRFDIWICFVPMIPVHIYWWEKEKPNNDWVDTRSEDRMSRFF